MNNDREREYFEEDKEIENMKIIYRHTRWKKELGVHILSCIREISESVRFKFGLGRDTAYEN